MLSVYFASFSSYREDFVSVENYVMLIVPQAGTADGKGTDSSARWRPRPKIMVDSERQTSISYK